MNGKGLFEVITFWDPPDAYKSFYIFFQKIVFFVSFLFYLLKSTSLLFDKTQETTCFSVFTEKLVFCSFSHFFRVLAPKRSIVLPTNLTTRQFGRFVLFLSKKLEKTHFCSKKTAPISFDRTVRIMWFPAKTAAVFRS